jgi:hypothetical protein
VIFEKSAGPTDISSNVIGGNLQIYENNVEGAFCPPPPPPIDPPPDPPPPPPPPCPIFENGHFNDNMVGGNMQVYKNQGPTEISRNRIVQSLQCFENDPPPVGVGNMASKAEGQCRVLPPPPDPPEV